MHTGSLKERGGIPLEITKNVRGEPKNALGPPWSPVVSERKELESKWTRGASQGD
jgi:hypothetical protein